MPTEKQMEKLGGDAARQEAAAPSPTPGPADPMPEAYLDAVLRDPRGPVQTGAPIQQRLPVGDLRHLLRVSCRRCDRIVEAQTADAIRLYGRNEMWKDAGRRLLDSNCKNRIGSHEDDGCWPAYDAPRRGAEAPSHPMSGGDRKALKKELRVTRGITRTSPTRRPR